MTLTEWWLKSAFSAALNSEGARDALRASQEGSQGALKSLNDAGGAAADALSTIGEELSGKDGVQNALGDARDAIVRTGNLLGGIINKMRGISDPRCLLPPAPPSSSGAGTDSGSGGSADACE